MRKPGTLAALFLLALTGLCAAEFAYLAAKIWYRYPDNHGGSALNEAWPFGLAIAGSLLGRVVTGRVFRLPLALSLAGLLLLAALDHWNIWVDHAEWCARGMPEWGTSVSSSVRQAVP